MRKIVASLTHCDDEGEIIASDEVWQVFSLGRLKYALGQLCAKIQETQTCWFPADHPGPCSRFYLQGIRYDTPGYWEVYVDFGLPTLTQASTDRVLRLLNS